MSSFLKLEGIAGESGDPKHRGEFDIDDMRFGNGGIFGSNPVPEKTPVITVTRRIDKDSNKLLAACAIGTIFPNGKITLDVENKVKTLTMNNILIQSYKSPGNSEESIESIELSVEKYSVAAPK